MKRILFLVSWLPLIAAAQQKGIRFEQSMSWQEAIDLSRKTGKMIFADVCNPSSDACKRMEATVINQEKVGDFFNERFIALKMTVDTLQDGKASLSGSISDPSTIESAYHLNDFPTFLFFNPGGDLVHQSIGYKDANALLSLAAEAKRPDRQYYTLLKAFKSGRSEYASMAYLATTARDLKEKEVASSVAKVYIDRCLMSLPIDSLYKEKNIDFIAEFVHADDRAFQLFYSHPIQVDSVMNREHYARDVVDRVITAEAVDPRLWKNADYVTVIAENPDWTAIENSVRKKYGTDNAHRAVLNAKIRWYGSRKQWTDYSRSVVEMVENYGPYVPYDVKLSKDLKFNWNAWDMFQHSSDRVVLEKALDWSDSAMKNSLKPDAQYLDTYANLLYKLGRKREAIAWQHKAIALDPSMQDIKENLEKMQNNEPTWPLE